MGQKVNPHGLRVGVIKGWDSRWFAKDEQVGDLLVEDHKIRTYLKKNLYAAGVPRIEIERDSAKMRIFIHCARPGIIVGKGGSEIEKLQKTLSDMVGKPVSVSIVEVRSPDLNAQLVAENIASQLEKRISFRRAMKQAMGRAMKLGAKGIKTCVSGRLGGAEIARTEHYHEGTIPLQTLRADIDYGFAEAHTTYGRIGVKVWLYKGEVLTGGPRTTSVEAPRRDRRERRGPRREGNDRPRREGQGGRYGERKQFSAGPRGPQGGRPYSPRPQGDRPQRTPAAPKTEGGAQ
ncbi:MAG TPA: 30S ribosomal protein S3 [Candidatus Ventrousia excrementavium]|uniref:Small ribosomal subunit protein uS3 n=1 Tax=Candidatus Ventrousia excrementavium TaxID=2840961 RepID=A0A9D1LM51_9CLOT|nr:30S ribosomal protein S3 [Candidatus Ventrousia excrementavium]